MLLCRLLLIITPKSWFYKMKKQILVNEIPITLERKQVKNINIRLHSPEGSVSVSAPLRMKESLIIETVQRRMDWILTHRERIRRNSPVIWAPENGSIFCLWGKPYALETRSAPKDSITANGSTLIIKVSAEDSLERRRALLERWCREELKRAVPPVLAECEAVTGLHADEWHIKKMKTRWGTCNIQKKRIWLSLALVQYPPECLRMVLIHELTHLLEQSHNERFYRLMDSFNPDWRSAHQMLSRKEFSRL